MSGSDGVRGVALKRFQQLVNASHPGRNEEMIRFDVKWLLLNADFGLGEPQLEESVADGSRRRIDVRVGLTAIETKTSAELRNSLAEAEAQLHGYVATKSIQHACRYNGILTDGRFWYLYEADPATDTFSRRAEFEFSSVEKASALIAWLQAVLATPTNVKPAQSTIESYLGASSPAYALDHDYLTSLYEQVRDDPTVEVKRGLWARLLRSALGTGFQDDQALFVDHTLLVIEAAAIGHAIMKVEVADLVGNPRAMLAGVKFRDAGLSNVIEADFFDWVLAAPKGEHFVRQVIRRVGVFNWSATDHDVLKVLYESVINAATRKGLGEYYTPDWLAEGVVEEVVTEPLTQRVLDPACGSGTFIFHTVRRMLAAAEAEGWTSKDTVAHVQNHVFGLDIHPVSVTLARITFLLALGDYLHDRGELTVPVHLGDAVQWAQGATAETDVIRIEVDGRDLAAQQMTLVDVARILAFPLSGISEPVDFDRLVTRLTDTAHAYRTVGAAYPSIAGILAASGITDEADQERLTETFRILCDLNAEGRDSIWGYYVRNQVRPLWLSMSGRRVDVLVGNPPWVAYRHMTESMQVRYREFAAERGLWHGKKLATNQDLVALFIVRCAELYLNDGGTFGFVTPLAVLSRQPYEGFRAGKWGTLLRGELTSFWDLDKVRPSGFFPVPAAVVYGTRHTASTTIGAQPVPYGSPAEKQVITGSRNRAGWAATRAQLHFTPTPNMAAAATGGESPYGKLSTQGATIVPRFIFMASPEPVSNKLGHAAGTRAMRSARSSLEKAPWKDQPDLTGTVETQFIHEVHLGATIAPFRPLTPQTAVLPITSKALVSDQEMGNFPGLHRWWEQGVALWEAHKGAKNKLTLRGRLDYQSGLRKQLGASTHRVLYSASGNTLVAVRVEDPDLLVEHKLYWLPVRSRDEARYLTAILNAPTTTRAVSAYQSRGLFGPRDFDKYVWLLPIPTFDPNIPTHRLLADAAERAEMEAGALDLPKGVTFQIGRANIRKQLAENGTLDILDTLVGDLLGTSGVLPEPDPTAAIKLAAILEHVPLRRVTSGGPTFPDPAISIDIDCEFDTDGVYLWGASLNDSSGQKYFHFGGANADETETATAFAEWLADQIGAADARKDTLRIFHYGSAEPHHLERILGVSAKPLLDRCINVLAVLRTHYFAPNGFSLKSLATQLGATWRTPGATGETTVTWIAAARSGDTEAWSRLLEYNEDDTRAMLHLRDWLGANGS